MSRCRLASFLVSALPDRSRTCRGSVLPDRSRLGPPVPLGSRLPDLSGLPVRCPVAGGLLFGVLLWPRLGSVLPSWGPFLWSVDKCPGPPLMAPPGAFGALSSRKWAPGVAVSRVFRQPGRRCTLPDLLRLCIAEKNLCKRRGLNVGGRSWASPPPCLGAWSNVVS